MKALLVFGSCKGFRKDEFHNLKNNILMISNRFAQAEKPVFIMRMENDNKCSVNDIDYGNYIFYTKDMDAFYRSGLEKKLRSMGITELVICGIFEEATWLFTAIAGYDRGFKITFIKDCICMDLKSNSNGDETKIVEGILNLLPSNNIKFMKMNDFLNDTSCDISYVHSFSRVATY